MAWISPLTQRAEFASAQESSYARLSNKEQIPIPHYGRQQLIVEPAEPKPERASICTGSPGLAIFQGRSEDEEYRNVSDLPFQSRVGEKKAPYTECPYSWRCAEPAEH